MCTAKLFTLTVRRQDSLFAHYSLFTAQKRDVCSFTPVQGVFHSWASLSESSHYFQYSLPSLTPLRFHLIFDLLTLQYGNTCYCNSVLQALYHCSPFRHHVIALAQKHQQQQATASDGQSSRDSPAPNNTDGTNDNKADKKKESAVDGFAAWLMSSTLMSLSPPGPQAGSPGTNGSSSSATPSDSSADKNHIPLWLALALLFKELGRSQEPAIGPKTFVRRLKEENGIR